MPIRPTSSPPTTCDKEIEGKRKHTTVVWLHFKRKKKIGRVEKAICNYWENLLGGGNRNRTRHLHDHFNHCLLQQQRDIKQSLLNLSKDSQGNDVLGTYEFEPKVSRKKLAYMVILYKYLISMVNHIGFREYSNSLQPLFKVVSRNTICSNIFQIFEDEKKKIMKLFEDNKSRIVITTDMWTCYQPKERVYDYDWTLHRWFMDLAKSNHKVHIYSFCIFYLLQLVYILVFFCMIYKYFIICHRFMYVPCPHNAQTLSATLINSLRD